VSADKAAPTASEVEARLRAAATEDQRIAYRRYFPGDDSFIGVRMGTVFAIAKGCMALPPTEIEVLLESGVHEVRAAACSIMGKSASHRSVTVERREALYELYLRRHDRIDDWDLVDLAAHQVVGGWLLDRPRDPLYRLARSEFWPERRTSVVATAAFLRRGETTDTLAIARLLASDGHDLVGKGAGWMLRWVGDIDRPALTAFLDELASTLPRPMLRAAIEKLPPMDRRNYLAARRNG
jgi:3-methyladenine DNA glycosylase AlkD